ncbi:MAG: hypothetical protein KKF50_04745 [Nanoarchaeota archaeon]|nr:hypothetical protein [Nanoarchaeota archaeon]
MESIRTILKQAMDLIFTSRKTTDSSESSNGIDNLSKIDEANALLIVLEEELSTIIDKIEKKLKPELSVKEKETLSGFREDLTKLEKGNIKKSIARNIKEAIEELKEEHLLACGMISARATLYMFEQIKAEGTTEEDKVKKLEDVGAINKGEKSKQTSKSFLEAIKSARNFILHDKEYFPDYSESSNYLSSTIKMAKIYLKYLELKKDGEEV